MLEPEPKPGVTKREDAEAREVRDLLGQAKLGNFARETVDHSLVDGVEAELRAALIPDSGFGHFPIDLLEYERRADAATSTATTLFDEQHSDPLARIFSRSVAGRLGISMPMVGSGEHRYPVMTAGNTAQMRAKGTANDATAATFSTKTLEPRRLTARYLFRAQDSLGMASLEPTLRRDLSMAVSDLVLNGTGTSPQPQGLIPALSITAETTTWVTAVNKIRAAVDGLHAYNPSDLRLVVGSSTFARFLVLSNRDARITLQQGGGQNMGASMVSSRIPAAASNVQSAVLARTSVPGANAVAPVWRAAQLIRDEYTQAASG